MLMPFYCDGNLHVIETCFRCIRLCRFYRTGLDLIKGVVRNNIEAGVVEPAMSKVKIIQVRNGFLFSCLEFYLCFGSP